MITAGKLAERSLKRILVQATEAPLESDEIQDFLDSLNDYMASLEARGIRLGYTPVSNVSDYVTIPDGAVSGIIANMAIYVASDFNGKVNQTLLLESRAGMRAIRRLGQRTPTSQLPENLPIGSGIRDFQVESRDFFELTYKALLRLVESYGTSFTATNEPVRVRGEWDPQYAEGVSAYVSGRIENTSDEQVTVTLKADFSATGDGDYTFRLVKQGESQATASATLSSTASALSMSKRLTIEPGEWVELWVEADTETNDVNLTVGELRIE